MRGKTAFAMGRDRPALRRILPLLASCALLSGSCSAATAQSWQCHAREGTYDEHDVAVPGNVTQFTGEMMIRKANGLSQWHPTATVAFNDLGLAASGCHCNGIIAIWYPEYPDTFHVALLADGKKIWLGSVPYDKPVRFKLDFSWDGQLKLEVGTGVATGTSSTPMRNNLHMSCSTADVDFNVTVVPPPKPSKERCPFAAREQWTREDLDRYCKVGG